MHITTTEKSGCSSSVLEFMASGVWKLPVSPVNAGEGERTSESEDVLCVLGRKMQWGRDSSFEAPPLPIKRTAISLFPSTILYTCPLNQQVYTVIVRS